MKLPFTLPISVFSAGANAALPKLPAGKAASTWALYLLALSTLLNTFGVDLFAVLSGMGLGDSPDQVITTVQRAADAVQQLLPLVFGVWIWVERLAPRFRLTFWGSEK